MSVFDCRVALLVSKHKKEKVIAPLLKEHFKINLQVVHNIDTDLLGTFSGEVERIHNQYETAKIKIDKARELYPQINLFIASEGAFNPHPEAPIVSVNTELILLIDCINNLEIAGWYNTYKTNLEHRKIKDKQELINFATDIGFPNNRIILTYKPNDGSPLLVKKGANTLVKLIAAYNELKVTACNNIINAETDMRACYNEPRMDSIQQCTIKLINNMKSVCPKCNLPGFSVVSSKPGLPCKLCGMPTNSILYYKYECKKCSYSYDEKFPLGKESENPMYCNFCNP